MVLEGLTSLSGAAIALLVGVGLLVYGAFGKPRKRDMVLGIGAVLAIGAFFLFPNAIDEIKGISGTTKSVSGNAVAQQAAVSNVGVECQRQTDGTNTLNVVERNVENSSLAYLASSVSAESGNPATSQASGTTTSGTSLSYLALNVPPCQNGKIYALAATGQTSGVIDYSSFDLTSNYELQTASQAPIAVLVRDNSYVEYSSGLTNGSVGDEVPANQLISGVGTTDGTVYVKNTTFNTGDALNFFIDLRVNGTATAYGAYVNGQPASDGLVISYDTVTASKWSPNSLALSSETAGVSLNKVPCPAGITNNRAAEACWFVRTLKASDGLVRIRGTIRADLGNPSETGDGPKICIDDRQYFRDTDSVVKFGSFDSGGTNTGIAGTCINFVVA